jgi:hypothetical protein
MIASEQEHLQRRASTHMDVDVISIVLDAGTSSMLLPPLASAHRRKTLIMKKSLVKPLAILPTKIRIPRISTRM